MKSTLLNAYGTMIRQFNNESNMLTYSKKLVSELANWKDTEVYEALTCSIEKEPEAFIQCADTLAKDMGEREANILYQVIKDYYNYDDISLAKEETKYCGRLYYVIDENPIKKIKRSATTLKEKLDDTEISKRHLEDAVDDILSKYIYYNGINKRDFASKQGEIYQNLHDIIDAQNNRDLIMLQGICDELIYYEKNQEYVKKEKVLTKLYNKALKKYESINKKKIAPQDKVNLLLFIIECNKEKIKSVIGDDDYQYTHQFTQLFEMIEHTIEELNTFVENKEDLKKEAIIKIKPNDFKIIENFYQKYHFYYKKSQIIEEINDAPYILEFYERFNRILEMKSTEKKINKLEELYSDIIESDVKKNESVRRVLTISRKIIEDLVLKEKEEETIQEVKEEIENEEKPIVKVVKETKPKPVIQIGKFMVYKDSEEENPLIIKNLLNRLSFDSQHHDELLENLVFQIGYDKVQGYLLKHPKINIYDLESVIKTDRKLRFEYQKILEEIEMYFTSSLTYYMTNKYDKKFKMVNNSGIFYHRAYLDKSIFSDHDEHYFLINQLNERIDSEIKNNNQQVIAEYRKYRHALNFSTAAGIMTFGWVLSLFQILNYYDKSEYLMHYFKGLSPQTFFSWMMSLNNLRNSCAHYKSFYRLSSLKELRPIMTKDIDANDIDRKLKSSSLFYYTVIMARLCPDRTNIEDFIDTLGILFRKTGRENYTFNLELDYSFPANWQIILEREKSIKIGAVM